MEIYIHQALPVVGRYIRRQTSWASNSSIVNGNVDAAKNLDCLANRRFNGALGCNIYMEWQQFYAWVLLSEFRYRLVQICQADVRKGELVDTTLC